MHRGRLTSTQRYRLDCAQWQAAADLWTALTSTVSDSPVLWKNLAIVRGYMGDYTNASYAYRRYAELATNEQDAIEAEATAQLLTKNATEGIAEDLVVTYHLKDMAELERHLEESDRAEQVEIDPEDFVNEAPPKVIYALVDRPLVKSSPEIARDDVPQVIGEALIFYADGDDPPRVELEVFRPQLAQAEALLREIAGDTLAERQDQEVIDRMSAVELALSWRWRLPDDVSDEHRRKLLFDQRRRMVLDVWPKLPMPLFGGKPAEEAADNPAMRTKLQAALLLLELEDTDPAADEICDELRRRLKLDTPQPIDPEFVDATSLRLARFARLAVERLSDAQLAQAFQARPRRVTSRRCAGWHRRQWGEASSQAISNSRRTNTWRNLRRMPKGRSHISPRRAVWRKSSDGRPRRATWIWSHVFPAAARRARPDLGAIGAKSAPGWIDALRLLGFLRRLEVITPQEIGQQFDLGWVKMFLAGLSLSLRNAGIRSLPRSSVLGP